MLRFQSIETFFEFMEPSMNLVQRSGRGGLSPNEEISVMRNLAGVLRTELNDIALRSSGYQAPY